jgi:hypothetical protein
MVPLSFYFLCFRHCPQLENDGILNLWIGKLFLRENILMLNKKIMKIPEKRKNERKFNIVDI